MFKSEPICILQAGTTIDGRVIEQQIIDEIAETYNPKVYTARINADHYPWSKKYGSVLSVEKRDDKLFAVLKPNSMLLQTAEQGQLLHTSCEFYEKFAATEKAYLTGLALTDEPASLGTTQIKLSAQQDAKTCVPTSFEVKPEQLSQNQSEPQETDGDLSKFKQFKRWLKGENSSEQLSNQEESEEMSKKTEELLEQSIEQNKELSNQLGQLVTCLSAQNKQDDSKEETPPEGDDNTEVTKLNSKIEKLETTIGTMSETLEKLSKLTDDDERKPAGSDGEDELYL